MISPGQLLAALLITRQVVGNVKESLIPYIKKNLKMAQLSYNRYGALSPTGEPPNDPDVQKSADDQVKSPSPKQSPVRNFSQVEIESSAPEVSIKTVPSLKSVMPRSICYEQMLDYFEK